MKILVVVVLILLTGSINVNAQSPKFSASMSGETVVIDPNGVSTEVPTALGYIKNLTNDSLLVRFERVETLPAYWNTNVCFGINCYAAWVSTAEAAWAPHEEKSLKVIFNTPPSPVGAATVRLKIYAPGEADTVIIDLSANASSWAPVECRKLAIFNDDDQDYIVNRIWLSDSINFSVNPRYPLPTEFYSESSIEYDLCINPRDGKEYTTKVFYSIGSEIREAVVTLTAPSSADVSFQDREQRLLASSVIKLKSYITVPVAIGGSKVWMATVSSVSGIRVLSGPLDDAGRIWVEDLSHGVYFVQVLADGVLIGTEKLLVE